MQKLRPAQASRPERKGVLAAGTQALPFHVSEKSTVESQSSLVQYDPEVEQSVAVAQLRA
jgi:hypothetical protein